MQHLVLRESKLYQTLFLYLAITAMLAGCSPSQDNQSPSPKSNTTPDQTTQDLKPLLSPSAQLAFNHTTELLHLGHQQHIAINKFLKSPNESTLEDARTSYQSLYSEWIKALPYLQMSALTNSGAPLISRIEKLPMLPGYLDQIPDYPFSGLVHDIMIPITPKTLIPMHTLNKDEQVIFGLPSIEFQLYDHFGEWHFKRFIEQTELSPSALEDGISIEQLANNRRRALLILTSDQLVADLSFLHKRWQPSNNPEIIGEDFQKFSHLKGNNLNLTLSASYQVMIDLINDALLNVQEKEATLNRAHFSRTEKNTLFEGYISLMTFHKSSINLWQINESESHIQNRKEFDSLLISLGEMLDQYKQQPANILTLELAVNRCAQLTELLQQVEFQTP